MYQSPYGPALGAQVVEGGTRFTLWTSRAKRCAVRLFAEGAEPRTIPLQSIGDGNFEGVVPDVGHGARYSFVLDEREVRDPYATWLPNGVEAPAMVWRSSYEWKHAPVARPLREHVLYELHVGTFTPEGTYAAATHKLDELAALGVTAVELMPLAAFAGQRGWGYDGVAHYAPFAPYGTPEELRAFIDEAHGRGLAVFLDVVYNHFGPVGNVLSRYGREYFTAAHKTPWGDAPNFEHPAMRRYVVGHVRFCLEELRFDGLRLDAVQTIADDSQRHILTELADEAAKLSPKRLLIAEDDRNDPQIIRNHHFDGVWADDFHHQVRVVLTGEQDGYYGAYSGTAKDLAETIAHGWFYRGAMHPLSHTTRGKDAGELPAEAFVYCIQNHDQVGNRALGDRLSEVVSAEQLAAATTFLLFLPMTPLLFMGQEWGATTPFLFFTDHGEALGKAVTEGRRNEFAHFGSFSDPALRAKIPDPQQLATFERSRLRWEERGAPEHARLWELTRAMLKLRATDPVLRAAGREQLHARADGDLLLVDRWAGQDGRRLLWNLGRAAVEISPHTAGAGLLFASATATANGADGLHLLAPKDAVIVSYEHEAE